MMPLEAPDPNIGKLLLHTLNFECSQMPMLNSRELTRLIVQLPKF
jgi:hypothetical protein